MPSVPRNASGHHAKADEDQDQGPIIPDADMREMERVQQQRHTDDNPRDGPNASGRGSVLEQLRTSVKDDERRPVHEIVFRINHSDIVESENNSQNNDDQSEDDLRCKSE